LLTVGGGIKMDAVALDVIAILEATDKSSVDHDYVRHYEQQFQKFRDEPIEMLEIGVADGASLRMWEQFFTRAKIIGVDIISGCTRHAGGRKFVEIGSQADAGFLQSLREKYNPTIIIDDGSHQADHIKFTIEHLFPALQPGGCYVIEDLNFHSDAKDYRRPVGALQYVLDLALMTALRRTGGGQEFDKAFLDSIDRIDFIKHAVFIWKTQPDPSPAQTIANMTDLIERSGSYRNWFFFIHYLKNRGALEQAEAAARKAISLSTGDGRPYWHLSEVLELRGDLAGALEAAEQALAISPELSGIQPRIESLRARRS
jgi:tetratricopeptide (TPR) repeat protein